MIYLQAFLMWLVQLMAMIILGFLRETYVTPLVGELLGHQLGTIAGCGVLFLISWLWVRTVTLSKIQALMIGALWLSLAVSFEFGFFHYLVGISWQELLADYNLKEGRLLLLLWTTTLFSPLVARGLLMSQEKSLLKS